MTNTTRSFRKNPQKIQLSGGHPLNMAPPRRKRRPTPKAAEASRQNPAPKKKKRTSSPSDARARLSVSHGPVINIVHDDQGISQEVQPQSSQDTQPAPDVQQPAQPHRDAQPTAAPVDQTSQISGCNSRFRDSIVTHEYNHPDKTESIFDSVSTHTPMKIKERVWAGEFIEFALLLKSAREIDNEITGGELTVREGQLSVTHKKLPAIKNIDNWTTAFTIFASIILEKWPNKGLELFKYLSTVRMAAKRGYFEGWVSYDEQYRLRKVHMPTSSWSKVDYELWMLYVSTPSSGSSSNSAGFARSSQIYVKGQEQGHKLVTCKFFNNGRCQYGFKCKFAHKCSKCHGNHPASKCYNKK